MDTDIRHLFNTDLPKSKAQLAEFREKLLDLIHRYEQSPGISPADRIRDINTSLGHATYLLNTLASNFLLLLDSQVTQLDDIHQSINSISQMVAIHYEKMARQKIGGLTVTKLNVRPSRLGIHMTKPRPDVSIDTQVTLKMVKPDIEGGCLLRGPPSPTLLDHVGHAAPSMAPMSTISRAPEPAVPAAVALSSHYHPSSINMPAMSATLSYSQQNYAPHPTGYAQSMMQQHQSIGYTHQHQRAGDFPPPPPPDIAPPPSMSSHNSSNHSKVTVTFEYEAQNTDELSIYPGEILYITKVHADNWAEGTKQDGSSGVFPFNYVEHVL